MMPLTSFDQIKPRAVHWLMDGRVPLGMLTLLTGAKGCGKSTLAAALAADVTGGPRVLGGRRRRLGCVLWVGAEEDVAHTVRPRLDAAGADVKQVFIVPHDDLLDTELPDQVRLVVLDPATSLLPSESDPNSEPQVRAFLENLAAFCRGLGAAGLLIGHKRKGSRGPALDQGLGSVAWCNVPRSVLRIDRDSQGVGWLSVVAANLGKPPATLRFKLKPKGLATVIEWTGEVDVTADHLVSLEDDAMRDESADAEALLKARVVDKWVPAADVLGEGRAAGIGERTLRSAKARLHIASRRRRAGGKFFWEWGPGKK